MPIAPAACQSSPPSELASGLAEPAVVTASANPGGADAPDVSPVPRPVEQHKPAKPRELAFAASRRPKAAVEVQELRAPKQAAEADVSSTVAPQPRATAVPENPAPAPKPESAISNKSATAFEWPVEGKIIQPFGANEGGQRNDGINISADAGTPIHAAANGTVTYASNLKGYGNLVLIKHHNGYITAYAHAEKLLVTAGDRVDRGDVIGYAGKSGGVGSPQLHFEIRKGTTPVDPRPLMTAGRES
ncbi:MAG TPA: peptidoglycan DD-metalloendopeptidase family protein [Rhizomicrobium sp.]|nr:peptidoglycan DD-metalloendopeptidase family protein [Rhizomicrobium sp.]